MFDIGFFEICLLSLVALLVLGPERLPQAARTVGKLLRRARQMVSGVRDQIDRELSVEDFRREMAEQRRQFEELQARLDRKDREEGESSSRDKNDRGES